MFSETLTPGFERKKKLVSFLFPTLHPFGLLTASGHVKPAVASANCMVASAYSRWGVACVRCGMGCVELSNDS